MAGIRAQYFEDLEEIAKKTKQQLPNTPGEKLYRMLVGDEETLNGLGVGGWEKIKVGKDESRLVIGKTSKGHKISVAPRLIRATKLATMGYTLEGHSVWTDFNSSSQSYVLMHPDLDVSLWTNETAQKQLFGQSNKHDGEAYHGRWPARVWRHAFPEADIEGDSGPMPTPSTNKRQRTGLEDQIQAGSSTSTGGAWATSSANKRQRTGREDQAQAGPSTSTGGDRPSNGLRMKELAATTYEEPQGPEAEALNSSDDDESNAEKQSIDQMLLAKYGLSSAKDLWEAFNKRSSRFQLKDDGMLRLLQRGWRAAIAPEADLNSSPDMDALEQSANEQQSYQPDTPITDTISFKSWQRKMRGGISRITFHPCPSKFTRAKEAAEEEEAKKKKATEKPEVTDRDEDMVRLLSVDDESLMRDMCAVDGIHWTPNTWISKSDLKSFKASLARDGVVFKGGR